MISPTHRPVPDNAQISQETNIHASGGTRTHNSSKRAAADPRLRSRCHYDQRLLYIRIGILSHNEFRTVVMIDISPNTYSIDVSIAAGVSWFFIDTKSFRSHYGSGVDSAFNRNEYQDYFLGGKGGRCLRLTTCHHPVPLSRNLRTLTSWNTLGSSGPVMGLLYLHYTALKDKRWVGHWHHNKTLSQIAGGKDGRRDWRRDATVLNMQLPTTEKRLSSGFRIGRMSKNPFE